MEKVPGTVGQRADRRRRAQHGRRVRHQPLPHDGILLETNGNDTVAGNYIGMDVTGTVPLGNGGNGVSIIGIADNTVGGMSARIAT